MHTIDHSEHVEQLRNASHGFGTLIADQRGNAIDLYAISDDGLPMVVCWTPTLGHTGIYEVHCELLDGVSRMSAGTGDFDEVRMLELAVLNGSAPVDHDIATADTVEQRAKQLEGFINDTLEAVQLNAIH